MCYKRVHIKYYLINKKNHLNSYRIHLISTNTTKNRFTHRVFSLFLSRKSTTWMMIASSLAELLFSVRFKIWAVNKTVKQKLKLYLNKTLTQFLNIHSERRRHDEKNDTYAMCSSSQCTLFWMVFFLHTKKYYTWNIIHLFIIILILVMCSIFFLLYNNRWRAER